MKIRIERPEIQEPRDNKQRRDRWPLIMIGLLSTAVGAAVLVIGAYAFHFWDKAISSDPDKWGPFGDYIGGILNPIFGFCSFSALLVTLHFQARSLKDSAAALEITQREHEQSQKLAAAEARRRDNEILKADLHEMIKAVHSEIQERFYRGVDFGPGFTLGYFFSSSAPSAGLSAIPRNGDHVSQGDRILLADLCELLVELNLYLLQYKQTFQQTAVTNFYTARYMTSARRLVEKGFLPQPMLSAFESSGYGWATTPGQS